MKKLSLFCFVDALGYRIAESHGFLSDVLITRRPLETIFGYSCTCDPTILTGELPRVHGHFSFYYYNPGASPFRRYRWLRILPKSLASRGRVRNVISRAVRKRLGYTGYFQLYAMPFELLPYFDYSEKRDLYQPGGINNGNQTIFDLLRERQQPFYLSDWQASEVQNIAELHHAIEDGDVRFGYLYLAAMDAILHRDGTNAESVRQKLRWYEEQFRSILAHARNTYDTVELHIFSDHGMTDVTSTLPLIDRIARLGLKFGRDYAAVYDSTMARFWFLSDSARRTITEVLQETPGGSIVSPEQLHAWGADFADDRYGQLFFLLDPGVLLCPSHLGVQPLKGMHGYAPEDKDSTAFYGSNVAVHAPPARLDDLFKLMEQAL